MSGLPSALMSTEANGVADLQALIDLLYLEFGHVGESGKRNRQHHQSEKRGSHEVSLWKCRDMVTGAVWGNC